MDKPEGCKSDHNLQASMLHCVLRYLGRFPPQVLGASRAPLQSWAAAARARAGVGARCAGARPPLPRILHRSLRRSPSSDVAKSGFAAGGSLRPSFFEESAEPAYWRNIPSRSQSNPPQLHPNSHGDGSNPTQLAPTPNQTHG